MRHTSWAPAMRSWGLPAAKPWLIHHVEGFPWGFVKSLGGTLWLCQNSELENGPFTDDFPIKIKTSIYFMDFPVRYVSHYQRVDDIETLGTINIGTEKSTNITSIPGGSHGF